MGSEHTPLFIPVVLGSIRRNRRSYRPAGLLAERVAAAGHHTELIDLRELNLPMYDEEAVTEAHPGVKHLRGALARADASVWLSPEYNHSFTSAVKNAIDFVDEELRRKPVGVCGLAGSAVGGARCVEQLKLVLIELHAVTIRDSVYFGEARTIFDEDGTLLRPEFIRRIDLMLRELTWYARALRWGREHIPLPKRRQLPRPADGSLGGR
ncbi:MAG: NAD(P)H-dependent oxidoreductase [Chloroflexi bacterium]|nr:NAD(P)H-dependent oxidoreductase [Chloroflexota bacterium]